MKNNALLSRLLMISALSVGVSAGAVAADKPAHPDLSATPHQGAAEKKTPGEASSQDVTAHQSAVAEKTGDADITTKIQTELRSNTELQGADISVNTQNGVVTLTGTVPGDKEHKQVVATAERVQGVKKVDSAGLKLKPN